MSVDKRHGGGAVKAKGADRREDSIISAIDVQRLCKKELTKLYRIVKNKGFIDDLAAQNNAVLIARGIDMKIRTIYANGSPDLVTQEIRNMVREYGQQFNRQVIEHTGTVTIEDKLRQVANGGITKNG